MMSTLTVGQTGEEIATAYLLEQRYEIVGQNYRKKFGEIDIISRAPHTCEIVFVEVKMRRTVTFGPPEASLTKTKWRKLVRVCQRWLQEKHLEASPWRIDFIGIEWVGGKPLLNHIPSISL